MEDVGEDVHVEDVIEDVVEDVIGDDVVGAYDVEGDEFMQANNLVYDDYKTEAFMRENYFDEDYEPLHDAKNEEENIDEIPDKVACYLNESDAEDDIGPVLTYVGPLPDLSFEFSDRLIELSEEEDEEEVCSSSRKKNSVTEPLKRGFCLGCRKFICVDGCFLKGAFKGQLLATVGVDGDNGIYPIAWAVVEVENTESWTWALKMPSKKSCLKQNIDCVLNIFTKMPPRKCHPKRVAWKAARVARMPYFEYKIQQIKNVSAETYEALNNIE
ncbi:hypothetical protein LIER_41683 [Lithospermum erythrorhizon]|uniref:MULE transposase domain-containing protein n=1 Tax=Lithospermum erythrorhizon TaxID=34254 RepID=A0AAV3RGC6_LITER